MVHMFCSPFSIASFFVISTVIGYFGVSDADVVLREDEPNSNKRQQQHLRRQIQLHPLRHYNKDEGSVTDRMRETEADHSPSDVWLDESMWEQIVIRALANPTEWVQLRQALDKVDADLRALTSQENGVRNRSKSAPKWKFTYHRVTNPELSSRSSVKNYKAKAIAAVLAVSPPPSLHVNNVEEKDFLRISTSTMMPVTSKSTVRSPTTPTQEPPSEILKLDSVSLQDSIIGKMKPSVPHYYLHYRNQNTGNSLKEPSSSATIKFPANHSSFLGRTRLEQEVSMMSSFTNDDYGFPGRKERRMRKKTKEMGKDMEWKPWIASSNYIPHSTTHDEAFGHKNKNAVNPPESIEARTNNYQERDEVEDDDDLAMANSLHPSPSKSSENSVKMSERENSNSFYRSGDTDRDGIASSSNSDSNNARDRESSGHIYNSHSHSHHHKRHHPRRTSGHHHSHHQHHHQHQHSHQLR